MAFPPVPDYTKSLINNAGRVLAGESSTTDLTYDQALTIVDRWRACHAYPINTFRATLGKKASNYEGAIIAQRLKRLPTIENKLRLNPSMNLARMQDIGGLRAIVRTLKQVRELESLYKDQSRFKHELVREDDYIQDPRDSGYRGVHLVYKYQNNLAPQYNGLRVELQLRTRLQHTWATTVETMGTFLGQALKSRLGPQEWLDFFALTASAFAHIEKTPLVPGYENLSEKETFETVAYAEAELEVLEKLKTYSAVMKVISEDEKRWSYQLITLYSEQNRVTIVSYARGELERASTDYAAAEKRAAAGERIESVLVSAGPIDALRRAYPNYFLDVRDFIGRIEKIVATVDKRSAQPSPAR